MRPLVHSNVLTNIFVAGAAIRRILGTVISIPFAAAALLSLSQPFARAEGWQPSAGHKQIEIWPNAVPDAIPNPRPESVGPPPGREWWPRVNDVSRPTMTMYAPQGRNTGVAVVVFPGGGYQFLAMDSEGTEICDWLTSRGIVCVLVKYRVPGSGPYWDAQNNRHVEPKARTALQDAQRTVGLVRLNAVKWHVDPHKIGVIGFSAGGHIVAGVSTQFAQRSYPTVDAADNESCRPDFAIAVYPGHLWGGERECCSCRDPPLHQLRHQCPHRHTANLPGASRG